MVSKSLITNATFKIFNFLMNTFYMLLKAWTMSKLLRTNAAFKIFNFLMNSFYIMLNVGIQSKLLSTNATAKILAFLRTGFKCHWRLFFRQNFLLLVLHSKAFALTKLKPDASFLADGGAKGNSLRNVAMPSPPRPPPAIQPRIPGIQRMINTQSGLKRNNYAFYFFKNPNRQFSSCQPRSSDCVLVRNPAQRGMSQRKRNQRIGKK